MFRTNLNKKIGPFFIILIAIMMIAFGLLRISLGFIGINDTALITHIRRQGGERNEAIPNRYTYALSYTFTLPGGEKMDGFTYKIGDSVYIKVSDSDICMTPIRYFKALPHINALESDSGLKAGNLILIGAGIIMIKFVNPRKRK